MEDNAEWLELLRDYEGDIRDHPGKDKVVDDALSRQRNDDTTVKKFEPYKGATDHDRQKSYADSEASLNWMEFKSRDKVCFKYRPLERRRSLAYTGGEVKPQVLLDLQVLEKVGEIALQARLPEDF
ncbi:hypothetical protein Tco_1145869 [Tanacetum coccineum]